MSYRVPIALGNVLRPAVDELLNRALRHDPSMKAPVGYKSFQALSLPTC
jgi:hypothetical protein